MQSVHQQSALLLVIYGSILTDCLRLQTGKRVFIWEEDAVTQQRFPLHTYTHTPPCKTHTVSIWRILQGGVCI